jgi:hypothetical protein
MHSLYFRGARQICLSGAAFCSFPHKIFSLLSCTDKEAKRLSPQTPSSINSFWFFLRLLPIWMTPSMVIRTPLKVLLVIFFLSYSSLNDNSLSSVMVVICYCHQLRHLHVAPHMQMHHCQHLIPSHGLRTFFFLSSWY